MPGHPTRVILIDNELTMAHWNRVVQNKIEVEVQLFTIVSDTGTDEDHTSTSQLIEFATRA